MTREEAVKLVKEVTGMSLDWDDAHYEALQMAIKALEQQKPIEKFENAKDHIFKLAGDYKCWDNRLTHDEALELCHILEQEPCEDAISRKAVVKYIKASDADLGHDSENEFAVEDILNIPPVTPTKCIATVKFSKEDIEELVNEKMKDIVAERKKGKWIPHRAKYDKTASVYECSICHKNNGFENSKYCPNCGAKMVEPQESEDKE